MKSLPPRDKRGERADFMRVASFFRSHKKGQCIYERAARSEDQTGDVGKEDPKRQFFSIAHLITPEALYAAFRGLRKEASAGVDGVTHEEYVTFGSIPDAAELFFGQVLR